MKTRKCFSICLMMTFLLGVIFVSQAKAEMDILSSLSGKGFQATALTDQQLNQERAKGTNYILSGSYGGTWDFQRGAYIIDTKREWIVSGISSSQSCSGNIERYYMGSIAGTLLYIWNSSTGTNTNVVGPIVYWGGGFGYVRSYGEISGLPRIGSGLRTWKL